jgi:hypothetical protein
MSDPSAAIGDAVSSLAPGPTPDAPAPYTYQPPQRTSDGLSINDPRMGGIALGAGEAGVSIKDLLEVLKAQQPNVNYDRGFGYNRNTGKAMGGYHPELDKGQAPQIGPDGQITGVQNLPGAVSSAADMAGGVSRAQEAAKAGLDIVTIKQGGVPVQMTRAEAAKTLAGGAPRGSMFGPALGVGQSPADEAYSTESAKTAAASYKTITDTGSQANAKIARYKQIDRLLGDFEGGKLSPMGLDIASAANSLGFKMDAKTSNVQAANAIGQQLVLDLAGGSLGTGFSNADRSFLEATVPSLQQSSGGRRQIIGIGIATAQRQQDIAKKARQWQDRFGRIDAADASGKHFQDYLDAWAEANPVFAPRK